MVDYFMFINQYIMESNLNIDYPYKMESNSKNQEVFNLVDLFNKEQ